MKIVFFGNTKYSTIVQSTLFDKFGLTCVVTIPDRLKGRKRTTTANPVKIFAKENKIPLIETEKLGNLQVKKIADLKCDFIVVSDFGLILPENLLQLPRYAPLNVHHSLLPKYRGPSPAASAILAGERVSGVTIIKMTNRVDAGPILAQCEYELTPEETTNSLLTKLNTLGAQLVIDLIGVQPRFRVEPLNQDNSHATYTQRFAKEDGEIDIDNPPDPIKLDRMIRAFYPWPGVYTKLKSKNEKLKIIKFLPNLPTILPVSTRSIRGGLTYHPTDPFLIQPEGKRPLTIKQFRNGYPNLYDQIKPFLENLAQS